MKRARAALVVAVAAAVGCGGIFGCAGAPPSSPADEPRRRVPADLLPADLDLVVRVDLVRVRSLGLAALLEAFLAESGGRLGAAAAFPGEPLEGATTAWLALRPGPKPALGDHVVVLRGRFAGLEPCAGGAGQRWQPPLELGAGWLRCDAPGAVARDQAARLYARDSTVRAAVTVAELDAVERSLELGIVAEGRLAPLVPPAQGTLSAVARTRALAPWFTPEVPALASLLGVAHRGTATVDFPSGGLRAELTLELAADSPDGPTANEIAERIVERLERLRLALAAGDGWPGLVASAVTVRAEAETVVGRAELDAAALARLLDAANSGGRPREASPPAESPP